MTSVLYLLGFWETAAPAPTYVNASMEWVAVEAMGEWVAIEGVPTWEAKS